MTATGDLGPRRVLRAAGAGGRRRRPRRGVPGGRRRRGAARRLDAARDWPASPPCCCCRRAGSSGAAASCWRRTSRRGGGLLIAAGPDVDGDVVGRRARRRRDAAHRWRRTIDGAGSARAGAGRRAAPDLPAVRPGGGDARPRAVPARRRASAAAGCQTLARFTIGEAAAHRLRRGEGRALVVASDLEQPLERLSRCTRLSCRSCTRRCGIWRARARTPASTWSARCRRACRPRRGSSTRRRGRRAAERAGSRSTSTRASPSPRGCRRTSFGSAVARLKDAGVAETRAAEAGRESSQHLWQYLLAAMMVLLAVEGVVAGGPEIAVSDQNCNVNMDRQYEPIRRFLQRVRARLRALSALDAAARAALALSAVVAVALVVWSLASLGGRSPIALAGLAGVVLALAAWALVWGLRPLRRAPTDAQLARFIEEQVPALDDRLVTAVDVVRRRHAVRVWLGRWSRTRPGAWTPSMWTTIVPAQPLRRGGFQAAAAAIVAARPRRDRPASRRARRSTRRRSPLFPERVRSGGHARERTRAPGRAAHDSRRASSATAPRLARACEVGGRRDLAGQRDAGRVGRRFRLVMPPVAAASSTASSPDRSRPRCTV